MITAILLLALMQAQDPAATTPDRTEKLTASEVKQLADANQAVADAQAKLIQAKAALKGTTDGIELAHHANTDCGCYVESTGRDYDKVEFKGDTIVNHHIHEAPVWIIPCMGGGAGSRTSGSSSVSISKKIPAGFFRCARCAASCRPRWRASSKCSMTIRLRTLCA